MKVGDAVVPLQGHDLVSGCACYAYAVVVSLTPFIMISTAGDMLWACQKAENFYTIGKASESDIKNAFQRYYRSYPNLKPKPWYTKLLQIFDVG